MGARSIKWQFACVLTEACPQSVDVISEAVYSHAHQLQRHCFFGKEQFRRNAIFLGKHDLSKEKLNISYRGTVLCDETL